MLRLEDGDNFIELNLVSREEDPDSPAFGDACFSVSARSFGFAGGAEEFWVDRDELRTFSRELLRLAEKRKGRAKLESMSPGTLVVCIESVDSLGHFGVTALIGRAVHLEHGMRELSATLFFEFDPSNLERAEKVSWVNEAASK